MAVSRKRRKKTALEKCDDLFGQLVRARGHCESGRKTHGGVHQCAHGFSRSYKAIRCDFRNAFCLCQGCHTYYTYRPLEWDEWLMQRWGTHLYYELRGLALTHPKMDWKAELERLREIERTIAA